MTIRSNSVILDGVTADPESPEEGELWYRSDQNKYKRYRNGSIDVLPNNIDCVPVVDIPFTNPTVITQTTYQRVGLFIFRGTNAQGTPTIVEIAGGRTSSAVVSFELRDLTNNKQIAEVTGITIDDPGFVDLGEPADLPVAKALFEIRAKRESGGGGAIVHELNLYVGG